MIKIELNNKQVLFENHYNAVSNWSLPVIDFYLMIFDALLNKKFIDPLITKLPIDPNSAIAIIKSFIKSKKKKSKGLITQKLILGFLKGKNNLPISLVSERAIFEDYYKGLLFVKINFRSIITETPDQLYLLNIELSQLISKETKFPSFSEILDKIFDYDKMIGDGFQLRSGKVWNSYEFTKLIDIEVCPYCNRNWIMTVENGNYLTKHGIKRTRIVNPQIDHFFAKSVFPLLQLSIYNMVPSCDTCNSRLKHNVQFNLENNLHPYLNGYESLVRFKVKPLSYEATIGINGNYSISLIMDEINEIDKRCISTNHTLFEIDRIYESHSDVISDLFRKRYLFSDDYIEILKNTFPRLQGIPLGEFYKIIFGTYYELDSYKKRPFSKLTKDLAIQLNLIPDN